MVEELIALLQHYGHTISTAESCTGGLIAATLVSVPGMSSVFAESVVTYANEAKHRRLGVSWDTLNSFGAVSEQTCKEMAVGACEYAGSDMSLVSTGIAGPDGGTKEKPVGLVYIGCCFLRNTVVEKYIFQGNRNEVREQSAQKAVELGLRVLKEYYK